jgi:hypothetical protein
MTVLDYVIIVLEITQKNRITDHCALKYLKMAFAFYFLNILCEKAY